MDIQYINQKKGGNILLNHVFIVNILNLPHVHTNVDFLCKIIRLLKIIKNELLTQLNYSLIILMYPDL